MIQMLRKPAVELATGRKHSALYNDINEGLMTAPVRIGGQAVAWPDCEINAINRARMAGKSDDEIRVLVRNLHEARKVAA